MTYKLAYVHAMKSQDMADDIDDLLREVEEKYLPKQSTAAASLNTSIPNQNHQYRYATTSAPPGYSQQPRDKKIIQDESSMKKPDIPSIVTKTTTRAHSSDIVCRELEDELSDLLDDDGRMSDAATVGLRCKRSPRRSASARELIVNTVDAASNSTASTANIGTNGNRAQSFESRNKEMSTSVYSSTSTTTVTTQLGSRSAPPTYHHQHSHANRAHQANISADVHVEKQKCFPIYLSGVIDSIDASQAVRVCSSLRCMGCDFRVSQFAHYRWRPGTDYLFLRNHMPEFDRVRVKLAAAKFCRAYACQCKFITVKDLVDLNKLGHEFASKWICLGH